MHFKGILECCEEFTILFFVHHFDLVPVMDRGLYLIDDLFSASFHLSEPIKETLLRWLDSLLFGSHELFIDFFVQVSLDLDLPLLILYFGEELIFSLPDAFHEWLTNSDQLLAKLEPL